MKGVNCLEHAEASALRYSCGKWNRRGSARDGIESSEAGSERSSDSICFLEAICDG
jgi:hypothetical protein